MLFFLFFYVKTFTKKNFQKIKYQLEISSKNYNSRYKYFHRKKLGTTTKKKRLQDNKSCLERMELSTRYLKIGMEFHVGNAMIILREKQKSQRIIKKLRLFYFRHDHIFIEYFLFHNP